MPITFSTKVTDKGPGFGALINELEGAAELRVGVFGDEATKPHPTAEGLTVGELAAMHELGLGVPERSYLRAWFDSNGAYYRKLMKQGVQDILKGQSRAKVVQRIGYQLADSVRRYIVSGKVRPPITRATADKKGHDTPLLDTAALVNAIVYGYKLPNIKSVRQQSPQMAEALRRGSK